SRSPKFFAKVTWVDTLSQLAALVPLNQINVPQPVYDYNAKVDGARGPAAEASVAPASPDTQVFGVPLATDTAQLPPRAVRQCISYIRQHGLATEGLFRRSPPSTALRAAKDGFNRGQHVDLALAGVHVACVLLKVFVRELPTPVFGDAAGSCSYDTVRALPQAPKVDDTEAARQMDEVRERYVREVVLGAVRREVRVLLCYVFALLALVARNEAGTRMTAYSLAVVWAPNMARTDDPMQDVAMCAAGNAATVGGVVQLMVQGFERVFAPQIEEILGGRQRVANADDVAAEVLDVVELMDR
ncbi:hypothetical protein LPJ70_000861, partial [Coemansia sp. RSA 2708]